MCHIDADVTLSRPVSFFLSKVQSVDQRMRPWKAVSAFANCGRAVAHLCAKICTLYRNSGSAGGVVPCAVLDFILYGRTL